MSEPPSPVGTPSGQPPATGGAPMGWPPPSWPTPPPSRGKQAIITGSVLMALGVIAFVIGAAVGFAHSLGKVDHFQRVKLSGRTGIINFTSSGGYVAYYESDTVTDKTEAVPLIPVVLTNVATGQQIVLSTPYGNRSDNKIKKLYYDYHGHKGLAMWQFHVNRTGRYQVELGLSPRTASDAVVAFGPSIATGLATGAAIVLVGVLLFIAGLITLIVGLVRRRRSKRELALAAAYGGYPYGGGTWGPGWAQPAGGPSPPGGPPPGGPPPGGPSAPQGPPPSPEAPLRWPEPPASPPGSGAPTPQPPASPPGSGAPTPQPPADEQALGRQVGDLAPGQHSGGEQPPS